MEGIDEGEEAHNMQGESPEVTKVGHTREAMEVEVIEGVEFLGNTHEQEEDLPSIEGRSNVNTNELDAFEKERGEPLDPSIVSKNGEGPQDIAHVDHRKNGLVDLNEETSEIDVYLMVPAGDALMTEQDEALLGGDTEMIEDASEDTVALQRTKPMDNHSVTSGGAAHGHIVEDLNGSRGRDMEAHGQHQLAENVAGHVAVNLSAVSDGGSGGDASLEVLVASYNACSDHGGALVNRDVDNQQMEASELVDNERKECSSVLSKENDSESGRESSGNLKDSSSSKVDLLPSSDSRAVFSDASLAQMQAQILVMGILRKGNNPSNDLLESACPQSYEGVGDPPPSKKRKPSGTEALPREASKEPSGHAGIATNLMTSVKENLNLSEDPLLLEDETYRQLRLAQRSAHDAMSTAASALAQSHIAWSQIRTGDHSEIEIAREAQIASVAATVAAATSVAKAAVEAAKAIANVSMKDFWRGGDQNGKSAFPLSKENKKSKPDRSQKSQMLASEAAGMASEDVTQTGTVLALASGKASGGSKTKRKVLPKAKNRKKSRAGGRAQRPLTQRDNGQPEALTKENVPHEDLMDAGVGVDIDENSKSFAEGTAVEVMTDEEGLRGGWFSGKVLRIDKVQAYVVYDEILDDDGSGKVKEWFPLKASGPPSGSRRQVRPLHPYSSIREAKSNKRQRIASGTRTWAVGECVDAYIEDGFCHVSWRCELICNLSTCLQADGGKGILLS
ncbi:uncharacterized protein [Physcomitrium patens]|uniref:Agenet domain-containing protein n=1 Tax=Physcomitrium patens TaxID=3218 RepID=A0A7I4CG87_PHYPA|nr:uncharacterized protein LOC112275626 isoform X2 [Physcomitrium patens]|eukprot:XP_024361932.1 uncharacterized protein LOC112275626 isoform X2 [Physcomitrella patens]